jgi:hypothetical protein
MPALVRSFTAILVFAGALALAPRLAHADQARDWMISAPPNGTFANVDMVLPGAQLGMEHRAPVYGMTNQVTLRANALFTLPFYETQADAELRLVVLTLGASAGYHGDLTHMEFAPDESIDRGQRRKRFVNGAYDTDSWAYGEGRATLSLPINDYVLFNAINYLRVDNGMSERTFDWRNGIVRDGGTLFKSDIMVFFKHRDWGGIGPLVQVLNYELGSNRFTQINYGFQLVTRPGFMRRNDILFLQVLFNPGSTFGTYDDSAGYGNHLIFSPIAFTLAYRMVLPVWRPEPQ